MPPLPVVPDVVRIDLLWSDGSDTDVSTRLFWHYSGSIPNGTVCTTIAGQIWTPAAGLAHHWLPSTQLTGIKVTDLSSHSGGVGIHSDSADGEGSGTDLAAGSAVLINYVIGRRYRGGKPRSYLPWGGSSDLATRQTWQGALVTSVDSDLATFFTFINSVSVGGTNLDQHVNVSFYDGFTVVTNPITGRARNVATPRAAPLVDNITSFATSSRVANQRRRNGR